jgi:hypothetical protein
MFTDHLDVGKSTRKTAKVKYLKRIPRTSISCSSLYFVVRICDYGGVCPYVEVHLVSHFQYAQKETTEDG